MIDFVAYKQWNLFLTVQEFGKSKIRVWWEDASWLIGGWLLNVLIPGGCKRALWGLIHKVTDTIHETSTLLNHVPETSPPNTITLAIRILTHESAGCGDTNTVYCNHWCIVFIEHGTFLRDILAIWIRSQ